MSYLMTLVHKKTQDFKEFFFWSLHVYLMTSAVLILVPRHQTFFLVQVPKTLHSEAHSDYIFDIPAISLGEILGSLGLGNNIDLSLGGRGAETSKDYFFGCAVFTPSLEVLLFWFLKAYLRFCCTFPTFERHDKGNLKLF